MSNSAILDLVGLRAKRRPSGVPLRCFLACHGIPVKIFVIYVTKRMERHGWSYHHPKPTIIRPPTWRPLIYDSIWVMSPHHIFYPKKVASFPRFILRHPHHLTISWDKLGVLQVFT